MLTDTVVVNSYSELLVMCMYVHTYAHVYICFIHIRHFNKHSATSTSTEIWYRWEKLFWVTMENSHSSCNLPTLQELALNQQMKYYFSSNIRENGNLHSNAIHFPHFYARRIYHVKDYAAKKINAITPHST